MSKKLYVSIAFLLSFALCGTHIDDINGELSSFTFDKVTLTTFKDCNLDKMPDLRHFIEVEQGKYPDLNVYISSDGEPKLNLYKGDKKVDQIRIGKYDLEGIKSLLADLGVKRDEDYTIEKKASAVEMERAFNDPTRVRPKDDL